MFLIWRNLDINFFKALIQNAIISLMVTWRWPRLIKGTYFFSPICVENARYLVLILNSLPDRQLVDNQSNLLFCCTQRMHDAKQNTVIILKCVDANVPYSSKQFEYTVYNQCKTYMMMAT